MNKRDAQQFLVAYKDNKREEDYALQHGLISKFKAKYLEKIPLGNGKFRYIYEEAKDKVKSTASNVANSVSNLVKTGTTNPGKMTANERSVRSSTAQAREAIAKQQEADAARAKEADLRKKAAKRMGAPTLEEMRQTTAEIRTKQSDRYKEGLKLENASKTSSLKADISYYLKQSGAKNPTVEGASDEDLKDAINDFVNAKAEEDKEFVELVTSFEKAYSDHNVSSAREKNYMKALMNKIESLEKQYLPLNDKGEISINELNREQKLMYDELNDLYQTAKKDYEDVSRTKSEKQSNPGANRADKIESGRDNRDR